MRKNECLHDIVDGVQEERPRLDKFKEEQIAKRLFERLDYPDFLSAWEEEGYEPR